MFRHEGSLRTEGHNRVLAGYLAFVAGFVNSAGLAVVGTFTSHVTGNVGRFAADVARGNRAAAVLGVSLIVAFFAGALLASIALESNAMIRRSQVYGGLLLGEAGLLTAFLLTVRQGEAEIPYIRDSQALVLCVAMGLQNSLVTRLSGAVVRTTHLTGVVTDLGIEAARWFRAWRAQLGARVRFKLTLGTTTATPFRHDKTILLTTILVGFVAGAVFGALGTGRYGRWAFVAPIAMLVVGGIFALVAGQDLVGPRDRSSSRE